jgi:DNA polymerase-3 subunit delta'
VSPAAVSLPDQPLAERILRSAIGGDAPAQQLLLFGPPGTGKGAAAVELAWALMDPGGVHDRTETALDLTEVRARGQQILLRDLEDALSQIASRPSVMARRVMIVHDAERLRDQEGAPRMLKTLEEPPPLSHVILVTDRPSDVLDTIRSRCLPVPFRPPGWKAIARRLEERGVDDVEAEERARAEGPMALVADPFEATMRRIGAELGLAALEGRESPARRVRAIQVAMETAADEHPSEELERLRAEAAALEGKRGGRTAAKKADDQAKRERRRMVTDGWGLVLDAAAAVAADALAVALGAESAVRHVGRMNRLREIGRPENAVWLERAVQEIQLTHSELKLNPTTDLAAEGLLVRLEDARHGRAGRLVGHGRLPF